MTRRQWTGVAGVLFGIVMLVGVLVTGSTPNSTGAGAVDRYTEFWADKDNQNKAGIGAMILTYACVLLVCFAAGLRSLLRRGDDGPLPSLALAGGVGAAVLIAAGGPLMSAAGLAAAETGYRADGNMALMTESIGYYTVATAIMLAAVMAVATALSNRRGRVLPAWTVVIAGLLALVALGSIFTAWIGFLLVPAWAIIVGVCLLAVREPADVSELGGTTPNG